MYNVHMKLNAKQQIKTLLASRGMTITELANILTIKTNKKYTLASLSGKFQRGSLSYDEVLEICNILHYEIEFKSTL